MNFSNVTIFGAVSGVIGWLISVFIGAESHGIGSYGIVGTVAGILTGILITKISLPVYRKPAKHLYWHSPLSVYLAIGFYGVFIFACRLLINDFQSNQIRWAVGLQSIFGMWWGITILVPLGIVVHAVAYFNHKMMRKLLVAA
jgi:hypothetical protein